LTGEMEKIAINLAIMLVVINTALFVGGYIPSAQVPVITRTLESFDLSGTAQTEAFQEQFLLEDDSGKSLGDATGTSFAVQVLDFLEQWPILGPLITLVRIVYELMFTLAFGVVVIAGKMGSPFGLTLLLGVTCLLIYVVAIGNFLLRVLASRGGGS